MIEDTITKEALLRAALKQKRDYIADVGAREWECLIFLIEEGDINSYEELEKYLGTVPPEDRI